jgi:hypothetical protein
MTKSPTPCSPENSMAGVMEETAQQYTEELMEILGGGMFYRQ